MNAKSIQVNVTGDITVTDSNDETVSVGGSQPQTLLAMLAIEHGRVGMETVAEVLWGDDLADHWRGALRGVVSKLRSALRAYGDGGQPVTSLNGVIRLEVPFTSNIARVEQLVTLGHDASLTRSDVDELVTLTAGLQQPFLSHCGSAWADNHRHRIEAILDRAEHAVLRALVDHGLTDRAIIWAVQVIARNPVDISTREALAELHLSEGNIAAARRVFDELEGMLVAEYATTPDAALRARIHAAPTQRLDLSGLPATRHHPDASEAFVGRTAAIAVLHDAWKRVCATRRPELFIIRGPAGIGKTRLADEAVALLDPSQRLWGRARPGVGRSWGPFADALAEVFTNDPRLAHAATITFPTIGSLLPELVRSPAFITASQDDAQDVTDEGDRRGPNALEDNLEDRAPRETALAVTRQIAANLLHEPTVLVVDDLQWAGMDGMALIESLLVDSHGPLFVIATCREIPEPFAGVLESVARRVQVTEIVLEPFDVGEMSELTHRQLGAESFSESQIIRMHDRTGGLPYYACALLRDARSGATHSSDEWVPDSVTLWLNNFLHTLDAEQRRVLELVSVFGLDADLAGIEAVSGQDPIVLADTLDALDAAGLVTIDDHGRVRIPHDITLSAVWESIGRARRAALHRKVGDYLATTGALASTLARQWSFAGPARRAQSLAAHLEAGEHALGQGAWQSAREHFDTVRDQAEEAATQIEAMIGAGRALIQLREHQQARATLETAADLAEHHGLDEALARATLRLVGRAGRGAIVDDETAQIERLRIAHDRLLRRVENSTNAKTATLLARIEIELAIALMFTGSLRERRRLADSALRRVRAAPQASPNDLATVLLGQRSTRITPANLESQIAELNEVLALPHGRLDQSSIVAAYTFRHEDLVRQGRRREAAGDLAAARAVGEASQHAYWLWAVRVWEALGELFDGELAAAERHFAQAYETRGGVAEAFACQQVNLVGLRLLQHRVGEMIPTLQLATDMYPEIPTWRAALALACSEAGAVEQAARHLEMFVDTAFDVLPMDTNRQFALGILAHVAATVGSAPAARMLWDLLAPYAGQLVLINVYGGGGAAWGPVDWALARLAPLLGLDAAQTTALWRDAVRIARTGMPVLVDRITREAQATDVPGALVT